MKSNPRVPMRGQRGRLLTQDSLGPDYLCRHCEQPLAVAGTPHNVLLVCVRCDTNLGTLPFGGYRAGAR